MKKTTTTTTKGHGSDCDTNCNWCARYNFKMIDKETGGVGNKRTNGDHPDFGLIKVSQDSEKCSGDFFHSNSSEKPSVNGGLKNSRMTKIIIMNTSL